MVLRRQNKQGEWIPAIPLPFYFLAYKQCRWYKKGEKPCDKRFFTLRGYQGHYALVHILGHDYA